ncbi:hypothetical protein BDN72DRAFT_889947 [Pluteus cervinus]|uniref:Uncharacterized protein n=1 Tax=Pluteus cervinus TaxID=181527 RepID=A0ACD3AA44_9AGAR|nr:hypothetical protein BDN72DRAFT_889947 [Pluteus cervinus]
MLRKSNLSGFQITGLIERLINTLFADDTTVYLSEEDNFEDLQNLLLEWCTASGAKFNIQKTEVIPIGTKEYRETVVRTRKINPTQDPIDGNIHIARDGEPVRVLGAFIGNNVEQAAIWTPTIEKIGTSLRRWNKSHPTQDGRRLIIGMEVGGRTQYLTYVQGMPKNVETQIKKMIRNFIPNEASTVPELR